MKAIEQPIAAAAASPERGTKLKIPSLCSHFSVAPCYLRAILPFRISLHDSHMPMSA